jgi:predicted nucleotidyltransferase
VSHITIVQTLVDAGVEFVIIGGWAAILHGSSKVTIDLDLCYSRRPENLRRLAAALAPFHPKLRGVPPELPFVWDEATLHNGAFFTLTTDLVPLDLLAEVAGIGSFEDVKRTSIQVQAFGRDVWTLDLPGLIKAKRAAGREKDLLILPELQGLLDAGEQE